MYPSVQNLGSSSSSMPCLQKVGNSTSNPITIDTRDTNDNLHTNENDSSISDLSQMDSMNQHHETDEAMNIPVAKSTSSMEKTNKPNRNLDSLIQYDPIENYTPRQGTEKYQRSIERDDDTIVVDASLPGDEKSPKTKGKEIESASFSNKVDIKKDSEEDENERPVKKRKVDGEKPEKRQYNKTGEYTKAAMAARKAAKAKEAREDPAMVSKPKRKYTKRTKEVKEPSPSDSSNKERAGKDDIRSRKLGERTEDVELPIGESLEGKDRVYWTEEDWNNYWEKKARLRLQERKDEDEWLAQNWDRLGPRWQYFESLSELDRCVQETEEDRTFRDIYVQRQQSAKYAAETRTECEKNMLLSANQPPTLESLENYYGPPSCNSEWVVMVHPKHEVFYKPEWDEKRRQEAEEFTKRKEESGLDKFKDEPGRRRAKPRLTRHGHTVVWWQAIWNDAGNIEWSLTWDPNCGNDPKLCKCDLK